ncbi:uncharacterized protein [Lolium perenne]|uniref:uncharacterized protein n=1 Tax=Lolium perenne TaxID=4522 RepID=UPI0021F55126|nr:uncharacterized protein LOC127340065 [Lolium perenne]
MEHLARVPAHRFRIYHLMAEGISFKITVTLRASRVHKWIRAVKRNYLDATLIKCVSLDLPQVLKEFLQDNTIRFCGGAIGKDVEMMCPYGIDITSAFDLQKILPNPTKNPIPSLYDLANSIIGTNLKKNKRKKYKKKDDAEEKEDKLIFGWANVSLSYEQVRYAVLDARLGFEMARSYWELVGYNNHVDRLNI